MTRVAILGTGKMGGAMARRLAGAGFELTLWNRTPAKAAALHLGRVVDSPSEALQAADIVISSLTNDAALRDVYLGDQGVLIAEPKAILVDMSTAGPDVTVELARTAQARGAHFLEAPVVGSVPAVESGQLLILVAGDEADVERAHPVLGHLGETWYLGKPGSAQRMKLIANSMLGITTAAAAELLAAATAIGLDRKQAFRMVTRFAPGLNAREHGLVHDEHTPAMFAVRDLLKDLDLGLHLYGRADAATPLTSRARDLYATLMPASADLDISAVVATSAKT
jgi:3-hydroxyisobutyrate dehydrogenase-like beta-hydroxyacid dehydrogenase